MRYLTPYIIKDLNKKMVILTGARQCGKTTLAQQILSTADGLYLNWDDLDHKQLIVKRDWSDHHSLIVLDEIHKYPKWKSFLKGTFDTQKTKHKFLVTGSARMDTYRKGGDSLMGRYHLWRLHPFTLSEIPNRIKVQDAFQRLLTVGGFPEPFLDGDEREARRWRRERFEKILKQDVREIGEIRNISALQILAELLKSRVGSSVVFSNLAEDLQISPITVKRWVEILESMYLLFQVKPFTAKLSRAIQKTPKIYFYDNADVDGDDGAKFENLVATHLLKSLHFAQDYTGHNFELRYIRDKEKHEVDFLILKDKKPIELIEVKLSDTAPSKHLVYFAEKLKINKATQLVAQPNIKYKKNNLEIVSATDYLLDLKRFF